MTVINFVCYNCNTIQDINAPTLSSYGFTITCPQCEESFRFEPVKSSSGDTPPTLSKRQKEVMQLLITGLSYKQIAQEIGVNKDTVETHIKRIKGKLRAATTVECVAISMAYGELVYKPALDNPLKQRPNGEYTGVEKNEPNSEISK